MSIKHKIQFGIGIVAFCIWSAMVYNDATLRPDYLKFIIAVVMGIVALVVRDMPTNSPKE